jgi:hypothetical protein
MENKKARKSVTIIASYQSVFNSSQGREILCDLAKAFWFDKSTISSDPLELAFREGQRSVVTKIMQTLKVDTLKMMDQIKNQEKELYGE